MLRNPDTASQYCEDLHWDLLTKKVDLIETQLRRIEKEHETVVNVLKGEVDLKEKANEFHKEISKQQNQLKQEFKNLAARFDVLQNNEETLQALSSHKLHVHPLAENRFGTTHKDIEALVQQRVQQEVAKAMEVAMQMIAKEQAHSKPMPHHFNNTYTAFKKDHHNTEDLSKVKNEQFKLMGEIERLKSRQAYVENICKENNGTSPAAAKNIETTELCKKGLDLLRKECDDLFQAMSNSFSELNVSLLTNKSQTSQLQSVVTALDAHAKHTEQVMTQFDHKLTAMHKYKHESTEILNKIHDQSEYLYAKVTIIENTLESNKANVISEVENKLRASEATVRHDLETSLREITEDFNKSMGDMTDAFNRQSHSTIENMQKLHSELSTTLTQKVDSVTERHTEIDDRLKELNINMGNISKTRAAIDSVLTEIDHRSQSDAAWSYNFNSQLQKYEIRLASLEESIPMCQKNEESIEGLESVVVEQSKLLADLTVKSDNILQELNVTMQNFKEDIHTSLINADNQNVQQFESVDNIIVKLIKDIPTLIERSQSDTIEMCNDKQSILKEELFQMVEKSNQGVFDSVVATVEANLKIQENALLEIQKINDKTILDMEAKFIALVQQQHTEVKHRLSSPQKETESRIAALMKSCLEEAKESYEAQLVPLLDIEDRFISLLDDNLEKVREDCTAAINEIVIKLRENESLNNSRHEEVKQSLNLSNNSSSGSSQSTYPSIVQSVSSNSSHDSRRQNAIAPLTVSTSEVHRTTSEVSVNSARSLHNVSQLVYHSPKKPTTANVFDNMRELGAPNQAHSPSHSSRKERPLASESVFDESHYVASSQSESVSHMHTTSSMFDSSINTSSLSGPTQSTIQLPPRINTAPIKPSPKSNSMVYLSSSHYEISTQDMSPDFSVSSLLSKEEAQPVKGAPLVSSEVRKSNANKSHTSSKSHLSHKSNTSNRAAVVAVPVAPSPAPSEDSEVHMSLNESFSNFNNIIDAVNTDIRALDLHLHDIQEGGGGLQNLSTTIEAPVVQTKSKTISPIKSKPVSKKNNNYDEDLSDSASEPDVLRGTTFLGDTSLMNNNNKDDLDLTSVEIVQQTESENRRAMFDLYQKKLNHRKSFRKSLHIE